MDKENTNANTADRVHDGVPAANSVPDAGTEIADTADGATVKGAVGVGSSEHGKGDGEDGSPDPVKGPGEGGSSDSGKGAGENGSRDSGKGAKKGGLASSIFDIAEMFALCATVVLLLFTFCARLTVVDGSSMENTLHEGEFMLVRSVGYKPQRGDIVVVDDPTAGIYSHPLIKRVIAVGGDTLDIDFQTWTVTVNGEVIDESAYRYLDPDTKLTAEYEFPITIEPGHVFVMGDNRHHSADSRLRVIGQIDERCVVGKAAVRVIPFSKFTYFD